MERDELTKAVQRLNEVIDSISTENCYDKVVEFFQLTSTLQDRSEEFEVLLPPLSGFKFCGWKSPAFKRSEAERRRVMAGLTRFLREINKAGRNPYGHNRTEHGQMVTKDNLYFGNVWGIWTFTVREFEDECEKDTYIQEHVRDQITGFVKGYKNSFNTDWL